jgi:hypothetical protein
MVQVGVIEYEARVTGADDARSSADDVTGSFREMGEQAETSAASTGFLAGMLTTTSDGFDDTKDQADDTDESFTILTGTTWILSRALGALGLSLGAGGISGALAGAAGKVKGLVRWLGGALVGALSTVGGYLSSFVSWLAAGSAGALAVGAAIGAVIGLFGVWILEITGVLDWIGQLGTMLRNALPGWARDGILAVIGLFAGPLAAIGGFIVGFIEGGFDRAFERAGQILQIFFGAFRRTFQRIASFFRGLWNGLAGFLGGVWRGIQSTAEGVWRSIQGTIDGVVRGVRNAWQRAKNFVAGLWRGLQSTASNIYGRIEGTIDGVVQGFENAWDSAVEFVMGLFEDIEEAIDQTLGRLADLRDAAADAADAVPGSDVAGAAGRWAGGGLGDLASGEVNLPSLQTGGTVLGTGIAQVHEGEVVGEPSALLEAAGMPSGGMGGGSTEVTQVDSVTVELSGNFDPTDLSRRQLDDLADDLVDRIGEKANRRSGIR